MKEKTLLQLVEDHNQEGVTTLDDLMGHFADIAFKKWEKTQFLAVSEVERHGFLNGYMCARNEYRPQILKMAQEILEIGENINGND